MLTTSNEYSEVFLAKKRLLLDSCILNDLATDPRTSDILNRANATYGFVYCAVSILEVGFGPIEKVDHQQDQLARNIAHHRDVIAVDTMELSKREMQNIQDPPRAVFSYNPGLNEWYAARHHLMKAMEILNIGGKRARELSNDAIIFYSAWNSRSALITNNVKDFGVFNRVQSNSNPKHMLPIFTIDDLEKSFEVDICFPENLAEPSGARDATLSSDRLL